MKTKFYFTAALALILMAFDNFSFAKSASTDPGIGQYAVSIPDNVQQYVVKETSENSVRYTFKKSDGTQQFLFSITKVPEMQWLTIRDQIPNTTMIAHKNGFIYYSEITTRSFIKGADSDAYKQVHNQLQDIIRSIQIQD
jgi:hypothetical protein